MPLTTDLDSPSVAVAAAAAAGAVAVLVAVAGMAPADLADMTLRADGRRQKKRRRLKRGGFGFLRSATDILEVLEVAE